MEQRKQTSYRERGQVEERASLGELEKNKGFLKRRALEKRREEEIKNIKKEVAEKNPDEFQFFIYSAEKRGAQVVPLQKKEGVAKAKIDKVKKPVQKISLGGNGSRVVFTD